DPASVVLLVAGSAARFEALQRDRAGRLARRRNLDVGARRRVAVAAHLDADLAGDEFELEVAGTGGRAHRGLARVSAHDGELDGPRVVRGHDADLGVDGRRARLVHDADGELAGDLERQRAEVGRATGLDRDRADPAVDAARAAPDAHAPGAGGD